MDIKKKDVNYEKLFLEKWTSTLFLWIVKSLYIHYLIDGAWFEFLN